MRIKYKIRSPFYFVMVGFNVDILADYGVVISNYDICNVFQVGLSYPVD